MRWHNLKKDKMEALVKDILMITFGSALYAFAFDLFLAPNEINGGGVSGAAMVICELTGFGSIGLISIIINIPLFVAGYHRLGRKFFFGSLLGMLVNSVMFDVFALIPAPQTEPLLGALYGGLIGGVGIGLVFRCGASTGGVDIAARLLKQRFRNMSMGHLMMAVDLVIVALTGLVYQDLNVILYCAVTLYVMSIALDGVVYSFEYSKVALIITDHHEDVAKNINEKLDRGATFLKGEGSYTRQEKTVVLCAVRRQQLAELKEAVAEVDPNAFVIVQEAHQVLGEGFERYSKDSL
jgi:uncharacterized membrane-anchored protein YitT (DUF2179 family)